MQKMQKKLLAVALAATMVLSSAITAFAETSKEVNITGGLGSANSGDETLGGGDFEVVYTFHNASLDTSANWFNFAVEVFDAAGNFITVRADAFGVGAGTGDYNDALGTWGAESKMTWEGAPADEAAWQAWAAGMADADVTATVKRAGKVLTFTYDITSSAGTYKMIGTTPEIANLADELSIHLGGEKVNLTNIAFSKDGGASNSGTNNDGNNTNGENKTNSGSDSKTNGGSDSKINGGSDSKTNGDGSTNSTNNTTTNTTTGTGTTAPSTGDTTTTAAVLVVMIAAAGAVIVLKRKKVSE